MNLVIFNLLVVGYAIKYCSNSIIVARKRLRHLRQSTKDKTMTPTTDPSIPGPSMTGATHNYFVLERHERDTANTPTGTENTENPYYSSPLIVDNYEDPDAVRETSFGTVDGKNEHVTGNPKSPPSGNVYNTFKQFQQQQEDYDHLGDHYKRPPQVTDNVYTTTQNAKTISAMDDTYNHLGQLQGATSHPDNVYGTPRVNDDYDRMPPASGTQASATVQCGTENFSTVNTQF